MAVGTSEHDNPSRGSGVQIGCGQETRFRPLCLDPASPHDRAVGVGFCPGLQPGHGVGDGHRAFEVQREFALTDAVQMGMTIGKAREQGRTGKVDDGDFRGGEVGSILAHIGNPAIHHDDDVCLRSVFDARVDCPAADDEILGEGNRSNAGQQQGQGGEGRLHERTPVRS